MTQPAAAPAADAPLTVKDLLEAILDRSGVDVVQHSHADHFVWFGAPGQSPLTFTHGKPMPMRATLDVLWMFQEEEEVRVYAVPNLTATSEQPEALRCYTFSKKAPTYFVENFPPDAFVQALADEWVVKAEGQTTVEREVGKIVEYVSELDAGYPLSQLAEDIETGAYDEEDEDETPETPPGPVLVPAPPAE